MNVNLKVLLIVGLSLFIMTDFHAQKCKCTLNVDAKKKQFNSYVDSKNYKSAEKFAHKLRKHKHPSCRIIGNDMMVTVFTYKQNLDSIKYYLDQQAEILKTHTCDLDVKMEYYASLSMYYMYSNELEKGVEASLKSLKLAEKLNDYRLEAFLISNLCSCFNRLGQAKNEFIYAEKLAKLLPKINDPYSLADYTNTIGSTYTNYASDSKNESILLSAREYINKSLSHSKKVNYYESQVFSYTLLSKSYDLDKNYTKAINYLDSSIAIHEKVELFNENLRLYEIYTEKSRILFLLNANEESLFFAQKALDKAKSINDESSIINATKQLAKCFENTGDYKNSTLYYKKYIALKESFDQKQKTEKINSLELKFNKAKNEQIIKDQKQKNELLNKQSEIDQLNINLLIIGILLSLLIFAIVFIALRQRALKQKQQLLETEQVLNRSRINPHFFFNILSSLQSFILRSDDKKSTVLQLTRFSKIMRQTLESTYNENVSIQEEITFLKEYLELQKFRKREGFNYHIEISDELLYSDIFIPSMLLQPFIENSIEHGISQLSDGATISINFEELDKELKITIEDNGKGLTAEKSEEKKHVSRATQITTERLKILNQKYHSNAKFEIIDTGNGVKVELYLPLTLN